jgi:threonine dehydrogenase-like Zn-dependent dehydrogenase
VLSEVNTARLSLAAGFGFDTVSPAESDVVEHVNHLTDGAGADVVFEVSGSAAGALVMTQLACLRGRIVLVAIYPDPQPVRLFDFFWKELQLRGARVYEREDYERAIALLAEGNLPLEQLITAVEPLERLPEVFTELLASPAGMKVLIDCQA